MREVPLFRMFFMSEVPLYSAGHTPAEKRPKVRNVQWFRGGLVFEAHRLLYHRLKDLSGPVTRVQKR